MSIIAENIAAVRRRIEGACAAAGRDPATVSLMGVTKTVPAEVVREAYDAGLTLFGENYVQEALVKIPQLPPDARWHMIGGLQSNKAKRAVEVFSCVQSLDRASLGSELSRAAVARGVRVKVLLEVNLGAEYSKSGCQPGEVEALAREAENWPGLEVAGLMALPPYLEDPEAVRPHFRKLARLSRELAAFDLPWLNLGELSMGMSHDFEVAIEEGATIVRVGTAIFGERVYK